MTTKVVFFTGGVLSSVGKGVTAAAIGRLLKARGFTITIKSWILTSTLTQAR